MFRGSLSLKRSKDNRLFSELVVSSDVVSDGSSLSNETFATVLGGETTDTTWCVRLFLGELMLDL